MGEAGGGSVISLPSGGGAIAGVGEKFAPDLFTGTGNFSVPIAVPPGRLGMQPQVALAYSTGNGNGPYGLGWRLSLPGVSRKTSHGVPRYIDAPGPDADVFVLSGAEDLVPVTGADHSGRVRYRPRTEGLFARIEHVRDDSGDYWEVRGREGNLTRYGTPRPAGAPPGWRDPAVAADPGDPGRIFGWLITETRDPLGNLIRYTYGRDVGQEPGHRWDQPLLERISYADYGDRADPSFLVTVEFEYEPRPDPFSSHRSGFEIRTSLRCRTIRTVTHAADGVARVSREYRLGYDEAALNAVSLLSRVDVVGIDESTGAEEPMPPLTFGYSGFDPAGRRFEPVTGPGLPAAPLSDPTLALVDLRGVGLPDVVELGAAHRFWRNAGGGLFELPRPLAEAPPFALGDGQAQLMDADGDGRPDLVVSGVAANGGSGYFPMTFAGGWSRRSFQPYRQAPAVDLADPSVKLVDLDGDGLTDVLRSGSRLEGWFNDADPRRAWARTVRAGGTVPDVDLADPRIRLADMTGDGLTDIVLLRSGNVAYWPNLGHNRWGPMVTMRRAPRLPEGYDPRRLLLGDVDGDGAADLVYVDHGRVLVWGNRSGNGWTEAPVVITGTPGVVDTDSIQLTDLYGTGTEGLLFGRAGPGRPVMRFLDLTGGAKPYLLTSMDNHLGALTRVSYRPSTQDYLRDLADAATRWRTTLPFPVHVVGRVEVVDAISGGRLVTEYRYRHGYWDGVEREFRGFALVEQLDTETFHGGDDPHYSPPTLTRTWFHAGPVAAAEAGDWTELDLRHEYWAGDPPMLSRPPELTAYLAGLSRPARRTALRALRGQMLRTELYARDGSDREQRPYTVTETLSGVRDETGQGRVFFPFGLGQRTTQWERGDDPMTQFTFTVDYDAYGFPSRQVSIAVPRGRDPLEADASATQPYLSIVSTTGYARRDDADHYLVDRVARTTTHEVLNDGRASVFELRDAVLAGTADLRVIGDVRTHYDGEAFVGLPLGMLADHGLVVRTETLAFTNALFDDLGWRPSYLDPSGATPWSAEYPDEFRTLVPTLAGYVHRDGGYYITTARHRYDLHEPGRAPRGLALASRDAMGQESRVEYDQHDLMPVRAIDPAGLDTRAAYDLRLLQEREVTDANGNAAAVTFSPAGFVVEHFVRGKDGHGDATAPSRRLDYDPHAFAERGQPASVRTTRRIYHDTQTDVPAGQRDAALVSVEYFDGFGRVVQTRAQAEDTLFGDPVFGGGVISADQAAPVGPSVGRTRRPGDPDNVVVSGWQLHDNKGRVVARYEPYFDVGWGFAEPVEAERGQRTTIYYDPRGNAVRTVRPDGSEERVVYGVPADLTNPTAFAPSPWEMYTYDANDNAGRTHGAASLAYRHHWDTPASAEVDALGRAVRAVARNGPDPRADWHTTESTYDIQGNVVAVSDAIGRRSFAYLVDLVGRCWRADSIDAGRGHTVPDAAGEPVEARDSRGALTLAAFDRLRRPIRTWARDGVAAPVTQRQRLDYGDGGDPDQPLAEREAARALNLLGRPLWHRDEAGLVGVEAVDFKGNVVRQHRRVVADGPLLATYERAAGDGWQVPPFRVDWTPRPGQTQDHRDAELLEARVYTTTTGYDAQNRVTRHTFPVDVDGRRREARPTYNRAGELESVVLDDTLYVQRIAYDAKGQRTLIAYGNGVLTRYAYDPHTFRLVRLRSERYTLDGQATYRPVGEALQDVGYGHDLAGNLLTLRDRTPGSGIPNTPAGVDALDRRFTYDAVYRLLSATGREHEAVPNGPPWTDRPRGTDPTRTQAYEQRYTYDAVGTMLSLVHAAAGGSTRTFELEPGTNRLSRMSIGADRFDYAFDANGNLVGETTSRHFAWNNANHLVAFATQTTGAEPSVHAHYLYDAAGQRVKKLVRRQGGAIEVTHYIGDAFEHHRWSGPVAWTENNHLHVTDDQHRIALVRVGPAHPDDRGPAVAVHLADHLNSSDTVVDDAGRLVSREEYTAYGETSFGSFTRKRYRFTGKERDEESGLTYHGARYLSGWTGRFCSVDPHQTRYPRWSPYCYGLASPLGVTDPTGRDAVDQIAADIDKIDKLNSDALEHGQKVRDAYQNLADKQFNLGKVAPAEYQRWVKGADPLATGMAAKNSLLGQGYDNADEIVGAGREYRRAEAGVQKAVKDAKKPLRELKGAREYLGKVSFDDVPHESAGRLRAAVDDLTKRVTGTIDEVGGLHRTLGEAKPGGYKAAKPVRLPNAGSVARGGMFARGLGFLADLFRRGAKYIPAAAAAAEATSVLTAPTVTEGVRRGASAVGAGLGAAIGATVGSAIPILGTWLGGWIGGTIGGLLGGAAVYYAEEIFKPVEFMSAERARAIVRRVLPSYH